MIRFLSIFQFLSNTLGLLLSGFIFTGLSLSVADVVAAPLLQRGSEQQNQTSQVITSTTQSGQDSAMANYELYKQLEALQFEVQSLRGTLEEQNYEIERLKKAEKERYADLDRRINEIQMQKSSGVNPVLNHVGSGSLNESTPANMDEDLKTYSSAKQRVDSKEYNAAIAEFTLYLEFFPEGKYVPQAHYWLGELYMALAIPEYDSAQNHFETVIKAFPSHPKVPDCLYKVGMIHKAQNKKELAKQTFQKLINNFPGSATASLAKTQLQTL
jgi:tol-pal system protein YbgF